MIPFLFLFVLAVLGLALYGLIKLLVPFTWAGDALAALRTLDRLYVSGQISLDEYLRVRKALAESAFRSAAVPPMSVAAMAKWQSEETEEKLGREGSATQEEPLKSPFAEGHADVLNAAPVSVAESPVASPIVGKTSVPPASAVAKGFDEMPGNPVTPRRTWSELLAGFMQENNIRWGELASGILIVGSAVGLVVSLREELRDTIPYFPALLFMLITAGINAAGVYTLQRWKLRNTSRGVLIIGLLLVPLNFLAACLLADERGLDDPIYWMAVLIGISGYSSMTWIASRYLLRWRSIPLFSSVMGSSISLLITNRIDNSAASSLPTWLLSVLPLMAFVGGSISFAPRLWTRERWSSRIINRMWLCVGIGAFAFLTALALIAIRSPQPQKTLLVLSPIWGTACVLVAWHGLLVHQGRIAARDDTPKIVGTSICVLGLILAFLANVGALAIPSVLVATSLATGLGLLLISWNRKFSYSLPVAWSCLVLGGLAALHLLLGRIGWDAWATPRQLFDMATSGWSGLCLMVCGTGVLLAHKFLLARNPTDPFLQESDLWNRGTAATLAGIGCLLAVIASFVHPDNAFDNHTATILLGIVCFGLLWMSIRQCDERWSVAAAAGSLAFLLHALIWNALLAVAVDSLLGLSCRWTVVFVTGGLLTAIACALRYGADAPRSVRCLGIASSVMLIVGLLGTASVVPYHSGVASALGAVSLITALLVTWGSRCSIASSQLVAVSGVVLSIVTAELGLSRNWIGSLAGVRHVAIQLVVLGLWAVGWQSLSAYGHGPRWRAWLTRDDGWFATRACEALIFATLLFCLSGVLPQLVAELSADFDPAVVPVSLSAEIGFVAMAIFSVAFAVLVGLILRPSLAFAEGLLALWLVTCGLGGIPFEEVRAFATADRWLLPIGGALAALVIGLRHLWLPSWEQLRRKAGGAEITTWDASRVQYLINFGLLVVVGSVLAITTIAISRFMLFGGESLGGPIWPSFFGRLRKDVSYGLPIGIIVSTFLFYAITERRSWLAVAGSLVYQYVVVVAIVLLFLSPHPKLASEWFLHVMQAVSLGMSAYGLVWYFFQERTRTERLATSISWTQLDIHTVINCLLVASLAGLVTQRFFFHPNVSAAWINEAGGPFGIGALLAVTCLVLTVWRDHWKTLQFCFVAGIGLAVVAFTAGFVDRTLTVESWWPFRVISVGAIALSSAHVGLLWMQRRESLPSQLRGNKLAIVPLLIVSFVALAFVIRGHADDLAFSWPNQALLGILIGTAVTYGLLVHSAWAAWFAAFVGLFFCRQIRDLAPTGLFDYSDVWYLQWAAGVVVALIWAGYYLRTRTSHLPVLRRRFQKYSNFMVVFSAVTVFVISLNRDAIFSGSTSFLAFALTTVLVLIGLWNDRAAFRVFAPFVLSLGTTLGVLHAIDLANETRGSLSILIAACVTAMWGYVFARRSILRGIGKKFGMLRLAALERAWGLKLPRLQLIVAFVTVLAAFLYLTYSDERLSRYASALVPLLLGAGLIPLAFQPRKNSFTNLLRALRRTRLQPKRDRGGFAGLAAKPAPDFETGLAHFVPVAAISLLTLGGVFLSWADLPPAVTRLESIQLACRTTLALGVIVFLYGWWIPRKLTSTSSWIDTIRSSTVGSSLVAIAALTWLLLAEFAAFAPDVGSGLAITSSMAVSLVVLAMVSGLLAIAVSPQHDPLSLSIGKRQGYVYLAQLVTAMLGVHLYLSMPWLFQFGILKYWPYIAMLLSFGGVGVAHLLGKRELKVLGQPIFNTGALIPVLAAVGFWAVDSQADASLVMLLAGLLYLGITLTQQSLWSGVAAILFGNLSLWLFYDKFPGLALITHPQLWLIPPAVSVLIAGQLNRDRISSGALATLRYISLAVIYLSSTSEVFISGLGEQLWPPMILALLSVLGIFAGMMFQVRAFLYLGSLFLSLAVITMVAHAQQRLNHVWPWWAFGLTLGTLILVMFGMFEKRRSDMQAIAGQLKDWD